MKTATAGLTARHMHLVRAAQCAGEAFAYADDARPSRSLQPLTVWFGLWAFAALALLAVF